MTVIQKGQWETATPCYWLMFPLIALVGYVLLANNADGNAAYEAMQVKGGRIETFFSPHQALYRLGRYVFDGLSLVAGRMGRAVAPANDQSLVLRGLACLYSVVGGGRKEGKGRCNWSVIVTSCVKYRQKKGVLGND